MLKFFQKYTQPVTQAVQAIMDRPLDELSRAQGLLRYWLDFVWYCAAELKADRAGEMAAALTYHTLFSLLPTLALMVVVLQAFVSDAEREELQQDLTDFLLVWVSPGTSQGTETESGEAVLVDEPAAESFDELVDQSVLLTDIENEIKDAVDLDGNVESQGEVISETNAVSESAPALNGLEVDELPSDNQVEAFHRARENLQRNIESMFDQLESINFAGIGAFGVLLFIFAATKLLGTTEQAFNRIFDAPYARPMYIRLPLYYSALTLAPLLLLGGQYIQNNVLSLIDRAAELANTDTTWFGNLAALATPFLTTWLLLTLLYQFLPNTRVRLPASLVGGFVAAICWIVLVEVMKLYVRSAGTANIYGALALAPLLLLWLWLTWLIVLFGSEVTYTQQAMRGRRFKTLRDRMERSSLFDPRWIIPVAARISESFHQGDAVRLNELQSLTGLPERAMSTLLNALQKAGFVYAVEQPERDGPAFSLARPPESIPLTQLLELAHETAQQDSKWRAMPGNEVLVSLNEAERQAAAGKTLADL